MISKSERRKQLRQLLATMDSSSRDRASAKIRSHLENLGDLSGPVAAFYPLAEEPDLLNEHGLFPEGWCLPRIENSTELGLYRVSSPHDLKPGHFSIREPDPRRCSRVEPDSVALFLVPGLGFDPQTGQRLGRGKGFYDRLLAQGQPAARFIGVAFARQLGPVPAEPHDIPMSALVTEDGIQETA